MKAGDACPGCGRRYTPDDVYYCKACGVERRQQQATPQSEQPSASMSEGELREIEARANRVPVIGYLITALSGVHREDIAFVVNRLARTDIPRLAAALRASWGKLEAIEQIVDRQMVNEGYCILCRVPAYSGGHSEDCAFYEGRPPSDN